MQASYHLSSEQNEKTENKSCWTVYHWLFDNHKNFGISIGTYCRPNKFYFFFEVGVGRAENTVKPFLSSHPKEDQKLVFKTNCRLMQVKVLQNAPRGAFCNTFDLH